MAVVRTEFPAKLRCLFEEGHRYVILKGGRGSGKSWGVAKALLLQSEWSKKRVLCVREIQRTIKDSVHRLLKDQIEAMGLAHEATEREIRGQNGSEFIFAGLRTNVQEVKSLEGVDICWVEEAQMVSEESWRILIPTIRKAGSRIVVTYNPDDADDPTERRFGDQEKAPPGTVVKVVNWQDNPWFPDVLKREMEYDYRVDPDTADHVWGGQYRKRKVGQIFAGKYVVDSFVPEPTWDGPYRGADWGFAQDPSTLVQCWLDRRTLYIGPAEAYGVGVELEELPKLWDAAFEDARRWPIRADNSRPETISFMVGKGYQVLAADKWQGSVEDGVEWLRSLERIVIHPDCKRMVQEARLYSYKVDRLTGDVLPIIVDKHNHCWDAVRYALEPLIRKGKPQQLVVEYGEDVTISPDLDEFELRQGW